jgi:hypothetical protein
MDLARLVILPPSRGKDAATDNMDAGTARRTLDVGAPAHCSKDLLSPRKWPNMTFRVDDSIQFTEDEIFCPANADPVAAVIEISA